MFRRLFTPLSLAVLLAFAVSSTECAVAERPDWRVGVGRTKITPDAPLWMSGYASRDSVAKGKLTELWAKAIAFEDGEGGRGVLVTLDLIGLDRETSRKIVERAEAKFDLPRSALILNCSHTHTGPVVGSNLQVMYDFEDDKAKRIEVYTEKLVDDVVAAIDAALGSLAPASLSWTVGEATFAVNRRENPEQDVPALRERGKLRGPVDHSVPTLAVHDAEGELVAIVFGYACHATVLSSYEWSGDWPGFAQAELERRHPGATALFWAGCGADQNPLPRRTVELATLYGERTADAVDAALAGALHPIDPLLSAAYAEIELSFAQAPEKEELQAALGSRDKYEAGRARRLLAEAERTGRVRSEYPYPVQTWRFGEEGPLLIALGGEVVVDYSLRLKSELGDKRTWVAGYSNDVMAYIPSRRVLAEGGYEGGGAMVYYGLPSVWAPDVEERIVKEVRRQVAALDGPPGENEGAAAAQPVRLLLVGDSITQGGRTDREEYTYRYPLYYLLKDAGYDVDFLGTRSAGLHPDASWPDRHGVPFDPDHEGIYGAKTAKLRDHLAHALPKLPPPDAALIHLGTNDQKADDYEVAIVEPLEEIVRMLRERNPRVAILLGHLNFNGGAALKIRPLVDDLAERLSTDDSPIVAVPHYRGWTENPQSDGTDTFDWAHPNPQGQRKMADRWFAALRPYLDPERADAPAAEEPLEIGTRRELFADDYLIAKLAGDAAQRLHRPTPREVVLTTDEPWEGNTCAYYTIFRDGDVYRMYYRGSHFDERTRKPAHPEVVCYAESDDGVRWRKPKLGLCEFDGSKENNIVWNGIGSHDFVAFRDTNPAATADAKYKGIARGRPQGERGLYVFASPDAIRWRLLHPEPVVREGAFDSQNVAFYDSHAMTYREYHRAFIGGKRAILTATSDDYVRWSDPTPLDYGEAPAEHLYTNAVLPYERAPHLLIGFPTRYLPEDGQRVEPTFMISRDGRTFRRWLDPVIPESAPQDRDGNRSNYMAWGLIELPGRPDRYSVYATEAYYTGPDSRLRRFEYRKDGFVSIRSGEAGGELVTPPIRLRETMRRLTVNFATDAGGTLRVALESADGMPLPGFALSDCDPLCGDHLDRAVAWRSRPDLAPLAGRTVRLRFALRNADLYAIQFRTSER